MKTSNVLRSMAGLAIIGAAVVAGYAVYDAQKTESVVVATRPIPPYSVVTPADVTEEQIPVKGVQQNAIVNPGEIIGHLTSMPILPDAQIRPEMMSTSNTLQGLVNNVTGSNYVTFSLNYKQGSMDEFIPPDTYVDLVEQGQNGSTLHANHVHVLINTGYNSVPSSQSNNQNQSLMLFLTLPYSTYSSMYQALANSSVQVLMVNQTNTTKQSGQLQVSLPLQTTSSSANQTSSPPTTTPTTTPTKSHHATQQTITTVLHAGNKSKKK